MNGDQINGPGTASFTCECQALYKAHQTTLTELISTFLEHIPSESDMLEHAPVVRRLTGLLSPTISTEDYKKHLEEKYGER